MDLYSLSKWLTSRQSPWCEQDNSTKSGMSMHTYVHGYIHVHTYMHMHIHTYTTYVYAYIIMLGKLFSICIFSMQTYIQSLSISTAPLNLKTVQGALWDAKCKWYNLGLELDLNPPTLAAIKSNFHGMVEDCFREVLLKWLEVATPYPSWKALVKALRAPAVDFPQVASKIESKYI